MVFQESQLSAFWFHHLEYMCYAQPEVTILHLSGAPGTVEKNWRYISDYYAHPLGSNQDRSNVWDVAYSQNQT